MTSYVRNVCTKNYKKTRYPSPSFISNVTDGFLAFLFILTLISCVLISPGSAEAYVE